MTVRRYARGARENQLVTNYIKDKNREINEWGERREKENGSRVNV